MSCAAIAAIGLHLASYHDKPGYNNVNPGIYAKTECGITAGVYENSVRKITAYVGYTVDPKRIPIWASVAVATGYKSQTGLRFTPVAIIGLKSPEIRNFRFRIGWIPEIKGVNDVNVFHLMIEKRF